MTAETKLREAASALLVAWVGAHEAGYRAIWPGKPQDLAFLAISETAAVLPPEPTPGEPAGEPDEQGSLRRKK